MGPVCFLGKRIPLASIAGRELHQERGNSTAERTNNTHLRETVIKFFFGHGPCFDFISKYANNNYTGRKTEYHPQFQSYIRCPLFQMKLLQQQQPFYLA